MLEDDPLDFYHKPNVQLLSVELDEDEDIIESLKKALSSHGIHSASIAEMNGVIKNGVLTVLTKAGEESRSIENKKVLKATGSFKLDEDKLDYEVLIELVVEGDDGETTGQLNYGRASNSFQVKLRFLK